MGRDSNPGGPGGQRRKIQTNKPQGKTSHKKGSSNGKGSKSMVIIAFGMLVVPASAILAVAGYLLHGHGVI